MSEKKTYTAQELLDMEAVPLVDLPSGIITETKQIADDVRETLKGHTIPLERPEVPLLGYNWVRVTNISIVLPTPDGKELRQITWPSYCRIAFPNDVLVFVWPLGKTIELIPILAIRQFTFDLVE